MDTGTHPPLVRKLEYVLELPTEEDLIESFPVSSLARIFLR